ncbi:hypothetical protein NBRC110019_30520 [Neptunitalea chrysea]|uniref:RHS repeat-associated core domain-containing protein n=1 Tax=Neptunitalea chrysea TaxID=1647581 RepID=A0A9W6B7L2_9FLAO|nr:RHS repeat-associated core domain-containing protein [Neptunitalea chrysea]GLB54011.1 hypothetical protein NBRC110019_30520 [Neptunitalea chrysea]
MNYFYQYKDHLGNNRLTYTDAASLFIEDTFDSGTSDWANTSWVSNDNERLKVSVPSNLNYVYKIFTIDPSLPLKISVDYDPGTMVGGVNGILAIREYDTSTGDWEPWTAGWSYDGWLPSTAEHLEFEVTNVTETTVMLILQRNTGNLTGETTCYLDNLVITQNDVEIVEENNYYPFGLRHNGYNDVQAGTQGGKFKYQGQELEEEFNLNLYEFELRHYDSALGRFNTTDPYEQFDSPYLAMGNNPIIAIDPNGGNCVDINGNPIACPEDEFYDDYRDNDENQITVLEEVSASNSSGSWSSEGLKDVPATWESPFANMGEFNNYYGTNFGQGDYDAAMRWLQNQQRDVMVAQHIAEFYRGRSEMSMGVLKLMFTIVTSVQLVELGTLGYIGASEYLAVRGGTQAAKTSSRILGWGNNSTGHLIKHRNALGFGEVSAQQAQKMLPQLRAAANRLLNNANPALTRVGQWHQHSNAIMRISNGKMLVTQADGTFITVINKTSNNWYNLASPLR